VTQSSADTGLFDLVVPPFEVRGSHLELLGSFDQLTAVHESVGQGLVVTPATRTINTLGLSVAIAAELGCPLLVLCSHGLTAPVVRNQIRTSAADQPSVTAGNMTPHGALRASRPWLCSERSMARRRIDVDTNRKRNLALAAAAMTGSGWVLFLDDDVLELTAADVLAGLAHLERRPDHHVVGWPVVDFPDNSLVHHARREFLGKEQACFVGGAALLVRLADRVPEVFPPVYNEDWLFLHDGLARNEVVRGRDIGQLEKHPYVKEERAASEEFGDVLAEGLFHLLHVGAPVETATDPAYWDLVRQKRSRLLARIIERLRELHAADLSDDYVVAALRELIDARHELGRATSQSLADFVCRWRTDLETWEDFYTHLPSRDSLRDALVYLGLHESWIVTS
jgi:hypothetical protein